MKTYIFKRHIDNQATNAPDEVTVYATDNASARKKIENIFRDENKLIDAHGEFMREIFYDFYSLKIVSRDSELVYNNLRSIFI